MEAVSGGSVTLSAQSIGVKPLVLPNTSGRACDNCQVLFACCVFEWGETVSFGVLLCVNVTFTSWRCKSFHVSHVHHFWVQTVKKDCWECCLPQPFYPEKVGSIFKYPIGVSKIFGWDSKILKTPPHYLDCLSSGHRIKPIECRVLLDDEPFTWVMSRSCAEVFKEQSSSFKHGAQSCCSLHSLSHSGLVSLLQMNEQLN